MFAGCKTSQKTTNSSNNRSPSEVEEHVPECKNTVKGTLVDKTGLDGCSMVVQIGDNEYLEPININELNLDIREGLQIEFTYEEVDVATICMMGKVVRITCVETKRG